MGILVPYKLRKSRKPFAALSLIFTGYTRLRTANNGVGYSSSRAAKWQKGCAIDSYLPSRPLPTHTCVCVCLSHCQQLGEILKPTLDALAIYWPTTWANFPTAPTGSNVAYENLVIFSAHLGPYEAGSPR